MLHLLIISLFVSIVGVTSLTFTGPSRAVPSVTPRAPVTERRTTTLSDLSNFPLVEWNTPEEQKQLGPRIFNLFSPLIKTFSSSITSTPRSQKTVKKVNLPQKVLSISPLDSLARFMSGETDTAYNPFPAATGPALTGMTLTRYYPVRSYRASQGIEGGWATSRPGPTGSYTPSTLEMVRTGESNYVTLAGDPSRYGEWYIIPEISFTNAQGQQYTLYNVPAYVHDTGSAFRGRRDKIDIATDEAQSDADATRIDRQQRSNRDAELIPTNGAEGPGIVVFNNDFGIFDQSSSGRSGGSTAYCGDDRWSDKDDCCYKHTGPAGPPGQYDGVKTCNAGYIMAGDPPVPVYIPNCGKEGANCEREVSISAGGPLLSCLFTACKPGRNAIWDPMTKRCGCDDGGGGGFSGLSDQADSSNYTDDGQTPPNTEASGDQLTNKNKLEAGGIELKDDTVQVGNLRENSINGAVKFADGFKQANPGSKLTMTSATDSSHDDSLTYSHNNGYKTDFRKTPELVSYIRSFTFVRSSNAGSVYKDTYGNRFFIENGGTAPHIDVSWQGNNL